MKDDRHEAVTPVSRRAFMQVGAGGFVGSGIARASAMVALPREQSRQRSGAEVTSVKALVFDVFGTVVDWRTSVAHEVETLTARKGLKVDGAKFADAWRAQYAPSMDRVRKGELPWTRLDDLHRVILDKILVDFGVTGLSEAETDTLNRAWHRLRPWPDVVSALRRLKKQFILAPLSNGNIALMTDLARYAELPWDCILGAELVRHYKPDPEVYRSASYFLDLQPGEVLMVAAHLNDLHAAKREGLRTAFVARPLEYGPGGKPDQAADASIDVVARDFNELASRLGA